MDAKTKRIEEDLSKLKILADEFPGLLKIGNSNGQPVRTIEFSLKIPTAKNTKYPNEKQEINSARIDLPLNYPFKEPKVTITSEIWNPNVYSSGLICHGTKWLPTEGLDLLVIWTMKLLAFDPSIIFTGSPANREAADWYESVKNKGYFPTMNIESYRKRKEQKIGWKNLDSSNDPKTVIKCPKCGTNLRVLRGHKLRITCSSCKNTFEEKT